ncbi:DUF3047 domain-containing protein [Roseibaca sp. Y0-43]|uniref:DUF3047 domain-containing protein n=1 Tax=Roseibaca sp. Y0-43 TaxID=2816854 RepID=UPI001D0C6F3B|nr:DUF3047 domain-containing protein [Roseibaca sp. Y0-43]MCC1480535.1 DUF3047 domain-containing protein [Roseibaca sp. Y0-43]
MRRAPLSLKVACLACLTATPTLGLEFSGWTEQRFSMFSSNSYQQGGNRLDVTSRGTVSLLWTRLAPSQRDSTGASWQWSVAQSVPPTALDRKGGDDRNLSLYFVFLPAAQVAELENSTIRRLLEAEEARVLMYVWGGQSARGSVLPSPYLGARGKTVVLRPAGTGSFNEQVNLHADLRRAFGGMPDAQLVGVAVSADSDDTDSAISAVIAGLRLN